MGLLSDLAKGAEIGGDVKPFRGVPSPTGRAVWREIFNTSDRSPSQRNREEFPYPARRPVRGGTYGRSVTSTSDAAFVRLLEAMRSMAPGGWSDDRWEQTRHFLGIAYVAIHRKSVMMGQAEFQVFKKDPHHPDGKRPVTPHDPPDGDRAAKYVRPYDLVELLEKPNRQDYFGKWLYRVTQQKDLTGTALTWMVPNQFGTPYEMYCVPTAIAIPQPVVNPDFPDGFYRIQPVYPYGPFSSYPTPNSAVGAAVPAQWMLRFQYPHPLLRYDGYSPLTGLRLHIDEVEMMDRSRWYAMKRSINPSAVLDLSEVDGSEPWVEAELERIRADIEATMQGPENHGQLLVPPPGGRLEPWGRAPIDMEYQAGWDQLVSFIMGGFGITKPAAGMVEDSSYSTLYATLKQLHLVTLQPECVAYDTPLITRDGAGHIGSFAGKSVEVWNGKRWSRVTVAKTGSDRQLLRVKFSDGSHLDCTPNHRFSVSTKDNREWQVAKADELRVGMATETFAVQHGNGEVLPDAYTLGVLFGDGQVDKDGTTRVLLYGEKAKLPVSGVKSNEWHDPRCRVPYVEAKCGSHHYERLLRLRADDADFWWQLFTFNRESILAFLAGWFDTDGNGHPSGSVRVCVSGKFRASMVQLLLTKCGIRSTIGLMSRAGTVTNYGRRSADLWYVWVADCGDIPCHRLDTSRGHKPPNKGKYQTIKSVEWLPGRHDTYCFTEPDEHKGVFNNTLTHQCDDVAAELTRHLAPFFGDDLIVEIRCKPIHDHDIKQAKLNQAVQARAITKNELRKELDLPLTSEPWGKEIAGTESPPTLGQPGMGAGPESVGLPQALGAMAPQLPTGPGGAQQPPPSEQPAPPQPDRGPNKQEADVEPDRPRPGRMAFGALGPRKLLLNGHGKSLNGHGKVTTNGVQHKAKPKQTTKSVYDAVRRACRGER